MPHINIKKYHLKMTKKIFKDIKNENLSFVQKKEGEEKNYKSF